MKKKANKKKETKKIIFLSIAIFIVVALIAGLCVGYYNKMTYEVKNPIATIEVEDYGTIKVELYPEYAQNTVNNFIALANNGFYDDSTFHRIIEDFMIQGGALNGDAPKSPTLSYVDSTIDKDSDNDKEYNIKGEFILNGYDENTLKLEKGVIAMARSGSYSQYAPYYGNELIEADYNSAGSQFFIMTTDNNTNLTGSYAGFGKVIEGFDVVEKVAKVKVKAASEESTEKSTPVEDVIIKSIRVETFDTTYDMPETHEPFDINSYFSALY